MTEKLTGKIKFWNERRGYGFIIVDDGSEIFGHDSQLLGVWVPNKDDKVEFVMGTDRTGRTVAGQIVILGDPNMQRR
jgi:cold shock CspA family protein